MSLPQLNLVMENNCAFKSFPLFPIPVGVYNFGKNNHELNLDLVSDIVTEFSTDPEGEDHSNMGGWHSKTDLETKYNSFKKLKDLIDEGGNYYASVHGYREGIVCSDLWANINRKGNMNFPHHHGRSALTGVYYPVESISDDKLNFNYIELDQNPIKAGTWNSCEGGSLVFQDPSYGMKTHLLKKNASAYNIDFYHVYPTSSILLLFPTYLNHMVLPFEEDKTRISISFSFSYGQN